MGPFFKKSKSNPSRIISHTHSHIHSDLTSRSPHPFRPSYFWIIEYIATYFKCGILFRKVTPGSFATFFSIPLVYLLSFVHPVLYMFIAGWLLGVGVWASEAYERSQGVHDLPEIVIDEVVGFLITMTWIPLTGQSILIGFLLFRFFDIVKPFPINWMDRRIPGGIGVMADDVLAGIVSNIILQYLYLNTFVLGVQWKLY